MKKRSLLANSTAVVLAQVWGMILALSITPYVYRSLGSEGYALFSLVLLLASYLTIVDFGFGWGIIKFVAEYAAQSDFRKIERAIRVCVWMSLVLGALMAACMICLAPWLVNSVFNVPAAQVDVVVTGIILAAGAAILILQCNVLAGVLKGLQRFDIVVVVGSLATTVRMVGYVLLLNAGRGLLSLWILTIATMLASAFAYRSYIKRLIPGISLLPKLERSTFKNIFTFSAYGFGTRLLTMPYFYLDKLFISSLLPLAVLSHYLIPFNLAQKIGGVGGLAVSVLFPAAGERAHDRRRLGRLYRRTAPVAYSLILPLILVAVTAGPHFLSYWIDEKFAGLASVPLILVAVGVGVVSLGSVDGTFLEGVDKPKIRTSIYAVLAVISLPLCYFLTKRYGINGTAATVCLAFSLGGVLEVLSFQTVVMKNWWYLRRMVTGVAALTVVGLAIGWSARVVMSGLWSTIGAGIALYLLLLFAATFIFHTGEQFGAYLSRTVGHASRIIRRLRILALSPFGR